MQQRLKNQRGFGIIEAVVALSLLAIATLAIVQWFSASRNSDLKMGISMKNLLSQRNLERSIWAMYDKHCTLRLQPDGSSRCTIDNQSTVQSQLPDLKPCDISTSTDQISYIALTDSGACSTGTISSPLKAEVTKLGCTSSAANPQTLSFDSTSNTISFTNCQNAPQLISNINSLENKNKFQITLWQYSPSTTAHSIICTLQNSSTAASGSSNNLSLQLSNCKSLHSDDGILQTGQVFVSLPRYSIRLLGKDQSFDGYHRFYY